jgi:HEAT repeat protein
LRIFARCLEHPNIMIRLEGLKILAKAPEEGAAKYIEQAMKDGDLQMRLGAYRALAARSGARAAPGLIKMMSSEDYLGKEQRERVAIATALGETKSKEALTFFAHIFEQKASLFSRGRHNDLKQLAIVGLGAMHSVDAFKVLAREVQNRANPKEIMEAAHKVALRLKTELTGGVVAKEPENG